MCRDVRQHRRFKKGYRPTEFLCACAVTAKELTAQAQAQAQKGDVDGQRNSLDALAKLSAESRTCPFQVKLKNGAGGEVVVAKSMLSHTCIELEAPGKLTNLP